MTASLATSFQSFHWRHLIEHYFWSPEGKAANFDGLIPAACFNVLVGFSGTPAAYVLVSAEAQLGVFLSVESVPRAESAVAV
jgi:hypothetical protein